MKSALPIIGRIGVYAGVGLVVGTIASLFGIGGGILIVPICLSIFRVEDAQHAVGTSCAAIVLISLAGALKHYRLGNVDLDIAAGIALGAALPAFFIGPSIAESLPSDTLKRLFGVFAVLMGLHYAGAYKWAWAMLHR
ncbi:MAG: sulfite exporter TauE/SafE family protein [Armatimonadota bacterium]